MPPVLPFSHSKRRATRLASICTLFLLFTALDFYERIAFRANCLFLKHFPAGDQVPFFFQISYFRYAAILEIQTVASLNPGLLYLKTNYPTIKVRVTVSLKYIPENVKYDPDVNRRSWEGKFLTHEFIAIRQSFKTFK